MDYERVSNRAYTLWENAGQPDGAHDEHWKQACREIEAEDGATMLNPTPAADMTPATAAHLVGEAEDGTMPFRRSLGHLTCP